MHVEQEKFALLANILLGLVVPQKRCKRRTQLDSLHVRRVKSDLIMCYNFKILHNLVDIDVHSFFTLSDYVSTRNNGVKLNKTRCCSVRDANFSSNRIVNIWNALPHYIVQASSITSFKRHLYLGSILHSFAFCNYLRFLCSRVFM